MAQAERFKVIIPFWLTDVSSVWINIPGLTVYFQTMERHVLQNKQHKYSVKDISNAIQYNWERRKEGSVVRYSKSRNIQSAFATDATFDGEEAPEAKDTTANKKKSKKRPLGHNKANTSAGQTFKRKDNKDESVLCSTCSESKHCFSRCYLVWGEEKDWILEESQKLFRKNMKDLAFWQRVENQRKKKRENKTKKHDVA